MAREPAHVATSAADVSAWVDDAVMSAPVYDLHTHLYPPAFGPLMLWGIDELLTYHYLIAETIRADTSVSYESFWGMNQKQQAELIWRTLFVDRAPVSEACRGVITAMTRLGMDLSARDLAEYRRWYAAQKPAAFVDQVLKT